MCEVQSSFILGKKNREKEKKTEVDMNDFEKASVWNLGHFSPN